VALMVFFIILGCFLDGISMVVLTMGVLLPTVQKAGIDLIWFGIFIVLVVEMAQITPPVGFNLFVLQGMTLGRTPVPLFEAAEETAPALLESGDQVRWRVVDRAEYEHIAGELAAGRLSRANFHIAGEAA
jgi:hypothetical protein